MVFVVALYLLWLYCSEHLCEPIQKPFAVYFNKPVPERLNQSGFKWGKRWRSFGTRWHRLDHTQTICTSLPPSRQTTTPTPHHSIFAGRMLFLTPNQQWQSTGEKVWYVHNSSTARRTQEPDLHNILRQSFDYPTIPAMPKWLGSRVVSVLNLGAEGPGFKSQPRRCRVTVLGKLFTPIVPLFTKQRNW